MTVAEGPVTAEELRRRLAALPDPEIPVITLEDLGILREVDCDDASRTARIVITPTYSGCPAMSLIEDTVTAVAAKAGWRATVETRLTPAWTTDWMSGDARERLRAFGIAPPGAVAHTPGPTALSLSRRVVACPLCGSPETEELARVGSTACKALRRCTSCGEPFDEFKAI